MHAVQKQAPLIQVLGVQLNESADRLNGKVLIKKKAEKIAGRWGNDWKTDAGQGFSYPMRRVFLRDTCAVTWEFLRCHPSDFRSLSV